MDLNLQNKKDINFVVLYILIGFTLLALTVTSTSTTIANAILVYQNLFYFSFGLILLAIFLGKDSDYIGLLIFGEDKGNADNQTRIIIGLGLGLILGFFIVSQLLSVFSINFLPQAIVDVSSNSTVFFLLFVGPLSEELLFRSLLIPSMKKWIKKFGMPFLLVFFALVIGGLTPYFAIAFLLVGLAIVFQFVPSLGKSITEHEAALTFIAVIFAAVAFGLYHIKSYADLASPQSAIFGAILFGIVAGYANEFTGTSVTSMSLHVTANAITYLNAVPGSFTIIIVIIIGFNTLVLLAYGVHKNLKFRPLQTFSIGG